MLAGSVLQWGHDFSAMDSPANVGSLSASTMWLQWGHDFSAMDSVYAADVLNEIASFNGATTFQPWIVDVVGLGICGSGNCFNGATTFQPWISQ